LTVVNNDPAQDAARPSLALDRSGNPVIALIERTSGVYRAFVKQWSPRGWTNLGGALNLNMSFNTFNVALKLDATDAPVVAWTERSNTNDSPRSASPPQDTSQAHKPGLQRRHLNMSARSYERSLIRLSRWCDRQ